MNQYTDIIYSKHTTAEKEKLMLALLKREKVLNSLDEKACLDYYLGAEQGEETNNRTYISDTGQKMVKCYKFLKWDFSDPCLTCKDYDPKVGNEHCKYVTHNEYWEK